MSKRLTDHAKRLWTPRDYFCASCLVLLVLFLACNGVTAQTGVDVDRSSKNLMVVLRESGGAYNKDEKLQPMGRLRAKLTDGKEVELEMAGFEFIGDMHIRFVFDGPSYMPGAKPQDLARLGLNPEQALQLAVGNIKRVYGDPVVKPFTAGLMQVQGKSPDFDSSYFLDRDFWRKILRQHPKGVVVGVPKRGGLVFAPLSDSTAVDSLRRGIAYLYSSSGQMRVSSALYLFKDDHWTVFQPPQAQ